MTKRCSKCREEKPLAAFSQNKSNPDGLEHQCRECARRYRQANAAKLAGYHRQYYQANAAQFAEYQRQYNQANATKVAERKRKYRQANPVKLAEYHRQYCQANAAKVAEHKRKYRQANPVKLALKNFTQNQKRKNRGLKTLAAIGAIKI